ncbi:MAG TPA: TIGR03118 family protein, partial [Pyrinomonadaceae bacterium]
IPANVHPFNIQNLGGALYVTYAEFQRGLSFDLGFVRKFDTNGVRDTAFAINNGPLVAPWGMAVSPANFGAFSNALLVGNSRPSGNHNPTISAFNPATGELIGNMVDENGAALEIDQLRALVFGNGVNGGDANTLYFSADIFSQQQHGLFGSLKPAVPLPTSLLKFSEREYFTSEGAGHIDITVTRSGDVSGTATVNYATVDRLATQKADYEIALGKLTFNPGDTSKTFRVLIVDDNQIGGGSSIDLALVLSNPTGAGLVSPNEATLFIMDNEFDTQRQPPNIIDDAPSFVRQHYLDFLNREPDAAGFDFWVNQITSCFSQQCIEIKRINVSAAFFLSIEFQRTGMLAYLTEKTAFGGLPRYGPFMRDVQALQKDYVFGAPGADAQLEANKQAFFDEFVRRPAFAAKYAGLTNSQYVFALFGNAEVNSTTAELYIAQLTGTEVVPSTNSPATGLVILRQTVNQPIVSVSLYLNRLTSAETEAHIHGPAPAGNNAAVIVTLPNGQVVDFQTSLTNSQLLSLSSGFIYVDVHTTNFPNGEIRAQFPQNLFVPDMIVRSLDSGIITRAQALRLIAESDRFRSGELNRAFVLMEYFGYLRRNPDDFPDNNLNGFNFWLAKLDQFNGNFVSADMVKAFIKSTEYRGRFGPP